jgi:hemoglobin
MDHKRDIENREDLVLLLEAFYSKAFKDDLIGRFFIEVVPLDLATHIPVIADFWESVILGAHAYRKNVMEVHQHIHALSAIKKEHLDRWVSLFQQNIDDHFAGTKATLMKQRAASIATLMDIKLNHQGIHKK